MAKLSVLTWIGNAFAVLCGSHGDVSAQARQAGCSRQAAYQHAERVQQAVTDSQLPGPGRAELLQEVDRLRQENRLLREQLAQADRQRRHTVLLDADAQHHLAVTAHAMGLSGNQIEEVFTLLFGHALSRAGGGPPPKGPDRASVARWVRRHAQKATAVLAALDGASRPAARVLAADEIFFHGKPVLVGVEPASMALLLCQRSADRTGATWQKALQPFTGLQQVVADQGSGLQAALAALSQAQEAQGRPALDVSLDVFHIEKEAQAVLARVWRQVQKHWDAAEAADVRLAEAEQGKRSGRGLRVRARHAWVQAEDYFRWHERLQAGWRQAKQALALFRPDGRLNDRAWAEAQLASACRVLVGPSWSKVRSFLQDGRTLTFLDRLQRQLAEAVPEEGLRQELVELWRLGHCGRAAGDVAVAAVQQVVCARLDEDWLRKYVRVKGVLGGVVRASSCVECVNSVLRMQQARHRTVSQGMLDLKRLYWNTRPFRSGRRRDKCPYQHLGVRLPSYDFWQLLQRDPGELAQELSSPPLAA